MIPIQILNNKSANKSTSKSINNDSGNWNTSESNINMTAAASCGGYSGKLSSWEHGLNPEFKRYMYSQYKKVGELAQFDTVKSPYYANVKVDIGYINYLKCITKTK